MGEPESNRPEAKSTDTWIRRMRLPMVSGKATAAIVIACLMLTGLIVIPLAGYFKLPPWIRFEILLGVWWIIWAAALARLLYLGRRVSDDHALSLPRNWLSQFSGGHGGSWFDLPLGTDAEGCVVALGIVVAVIVAIIGFWILIEVAIPALLFLLYFLVRGMLARVANDKHSCKDHALRSLSWGGLWALVYMAPLALLVWLGHVIVAAR
jgi:hypothetical protein